MRRVLFLSLLVAFNCIFLGCKAGNMHNATETGSNYEKYELKLVTFKIYNEGIVSQSDERREDILKNMRIAIVGDTLIINGDNKVLFSIGRADVRHFYNHRYGISNFYARELAKLGYENNSDTVLFLKPEKDIARETWTYNYTDMLGLGVFAGKYLFFPCILTDNGEENAMVVYEMPKDGRYRNTSDNKMENDHADDITGNSQATFDDFFEGQDIDINRFGIDTTEVMLDKNTLLDREWTTTIDGVSAIIINGEKTPFKDYISTGVNAIFPLPDCQGHKVFILFFEYGDSEYWEMCISDKGVINSEFQTLTACYTWDDWGAEDGDNADYSRIDFQIYPDYTIRLNGKKRESGKIKERTRYYRITSNGRFREIK